MDKPPSKARSLRRTDPAPSRPLVIYHSDCTDGFTAAWAAWKKLGDGADYVPARYLDPPPDVFDRTVFIVDFSYPHEVLRTMASVARYVTVIDHHKTAMADLTSHPDIVGLECIFDMEQSGAGLAWNYFHPPSEFSPPAGYHSRPWLVDYVEDRDLWRFKLPGSKEVNAFIGAHSLGDFEAWDRLADSEWVDAANAGLAILKFVDRSVESMAKLACPARLFHEVPGMSFSSEVIPVVNCPPMITSELVGKLAEGHGFAAGWFQREDGKYVYSLRSRGPNADDVSSIARIFGGGGHKNAAGFTVANRVDVRWVRSITPSPGELAITPGLRGMRVVPAGK